GYVSFFFFFQAEDGIRDRTVTGVQTCALPILLNGLEATRQITRQAPSSRVLILSSYNDDEYVHELTEAGGAGYLLKQADFTDVVRAIREAKKGNAFFSPAISRRLTDRYRETIVGGVLVKKRTDLLTSREVEVLQLIAEGESNKQIAAERSEEHTSELQSPYDLVCRLLLEK